MGVVGAGTMGAGIAQVAAVAGHPVLLYDSAEGAVDRAVAQIGRFLARSVEKGRMKAGERDAVLDRITPCHNLEGLGPAGLVVEAIVEDLEVKHDVLGRVEAALHDDDAILATNTSSLSITAIGRALKRPRRLVGMHFFNPAPLMALVEVVSGLDTDPSAAQRVFETAEAWGKSPVHARSTPGFIVNRVARPFYGEAQRLLHERVAEPATIDAVMRESGGFRMGPFELMDLIGNDVNLAVSRSVWQACYNDPRYTPSLMQQEQVAAGRLGRKSGRGWYDYGNDAMQPEPASTFEGPKPKSVEVTGDLGPAEPLPALIEQAGIEVTRRSNTEAIGSMRVGNATLKLADGSLATERADWEDTPDLIHFDLALDWAAAARIALAPADQASDEAVTAAAGLFQALGKRVSVIDDVAGMIVMRTLAMLANEAADAVNLGVCDVASVDTAMLKGVNYPRGPLAWADDVGPEWILMVIESLGAQYGEDRYRPSPLLRRKVAAGSLFHG